ncbi:uncharacterized protein DUF3857 [Chitinophaga dinghuensis]|uniref:Uncharacterized protein DUF3857 n=1 Tax=Chitinophaga dinghuensis TaxID=1539050 RepID=A0A327W4J0_9BACT|nr:DUF3857 domain-containing protein [Chitinophaga dinghuensis]RAJ83286.1 uncharacterized protein DUF3857 [Chitinophaga dinghuensis]
MQRLIFLLTVLFVLALSQPGKAQDNSFPESWSRTAQKHTVPTGNMYNVPFFMLYYREIVDFNISNSDKAEGYSYYQTLYKSLQVQQALNKDSFSSIQIQLKPNEEARGLHVRKIGADGTVTSLEKSVRVSPSRTGNTTISINNLDIVKGDEVEYELLVKVRGAYAGNMIIQSDIPCAEAHFKLIAPKNMEFLVRSNQSNITPGEDLKDNNRIYSLTTHNVPSIPLNPLYNVKPFLLRVEYGLHNITENGKSTVITWSDFGKSTYVPYVAISKQEAKLVEKELDNIPFLKQRYPMPQLIYMIEQYLKTTYDLTEDQDMFGEPGNLATAIRNKRTDKQGMIKLFNSFFYFLNIPCQMMFTSSRSELPLSKDLVNPALAENNLIYFPTLGQALAPTEMDTRFPCYPSNWINLLAVRSRDTLVNDQNQVLTDLMNTPMPAYTLSNISTDATLTDFNNPTWEITQSFGGYAGINLKRAFTRAGSDVSMRNGTFNSILPLSSDERKVLKYSATNETFTYQPMDKPVVVNSTLLTASLITNEADGSKHIKLGELLSGSLLMNPIMPVGHYPVELAFPFYFETRLHLDIPQGYKIKNKDDFAANITNAADKLGLKMRMVQDGQKVHLFVIQYFKDVSFNGTDKDLFRKILERVLILKQQELTLIK